MARIWNASLIHTLLLEACVSNKKPRSRDHREDGQLVASCYLCVFFEPIEHNPHEPRRRRRPITKIGLHRRVTHFLPCLLVKTHDNDDGKNMHETNVDAIGPSLENIAYLRDITASVCFQ